MTSKFDNLLEELGTGKWNLAATVLIAYWFLPFPSSALGGTYLAPTLNHSCRIPPDGIPILVQTTDNHTTEDACWYLRDVQNHTEKMPCTEWDFDNSTFISTLTSEFSLVCEREYLKPTFQSIYFSGALLAASVVGYLSDNYGRKKMLTVGMIVYATMGNLMSWLPNMSSILAVRFIQGLMHPTTLSVGFTLAMEECEPKHRATVGILTFFPWVVGYLTWAGQAYLIREWRWLSFFAPLPSLLAFPILWFVDESPRWLILKGHHDKALQVLQRASRLNRRTLPPEDKLRSLMKEIEQESGQERHRMKSGSSRTLAVLRRLWNETYILFRTRAMKRVTLCIYCIFFVSGMVYYGLSLSGADLGSDPFVYMALSGLMDIPGCTAALPLVNRIGRKITCLLSYLITGAALMLLTFIPKGMVATTFALIAKMTISTAYQVIYLHATELYPTQVRVRGLGTSGMVSKIGSVSVPYLIDALGSLYWWAPSVVCGAASVVAGLVCFLLPETLGMALPDTVADLERHPAFSKRKLKASRNENELTLASPEEKLPVSM